MILEIFSAITPFFLTQPHERGCVRQKCVMAKKIFKKFFSFSYVELTLEEKR